MPCMTYTYSTHATHCLQIESRKMGERETLWHFAAQKEGCHFLILDTLLSF